VSEEPLADGLDSVSWLPSLSDQNNDVISSVRDGAEILPFFPLGGIVYTPSSEHVLNIFEPRYRQMYNDILMNGSKRFVVAMSHPEKEGTFAETGVIFYLDELKEVSEQTEDQIKYVCNHKVIGRVKLHRIINPEAWTTRETYLKVEGSIINENVIDNDIKGKEEAKDEDNIFVKILKPLSEEEEKLKKVFQDLANKQYDLQEDIRFSRDSLSSLAVAPGEDEDCLWKTVRLWQQFVEQRLVATQNKMQMEFQTKIRDYLMDDMGLDENELPSVIGVNDMSPELQEETRNFLKKMEVKLRPLVLENNLTVQKILEADGHTERVKLLRYFIDAERRRLGAKSSIQNMFSGDEAGEASENVLVNKTQRLESAGQDSADDSGSIFMDEPDSFQ